MYVHIVLPYSNHKVDAYAERLTKLVNETFNQVVSNRRYTRNNRKTRMSNRQIKQINERTNIYLKFYFKIMSLSHNNVFNQNQKYLKSCIYFFINSHILIKKIRHFD